VLQRFELEKIGRVAEVDWRSVRRWARGQPTRPAITIRILRAVAALAARGELSESVQFVARLALISVIESGSESQ